MNPTTLAHSDPHPCISPTGVELGTSGCPKMLKIRHMAASNKFIFCNDDPEKLLIVSCHLYAPHEFCVVPPGFLCP